MPYALALALIACGSNDSKDPVQLTVLSWWAPGAESDAFKTVSKLNQELHPNVRVAQPEKGNHDQSSLEDVIWRSMLSEAVPSTFHATTGVAVLRWMAVDTTATTTDGAPVFADTTIKHSDCLIRNLHQFFADHDLFQKLPQPLLDSLCFGAPGADCEYYAAVPLDIHRLNVIYYNTSWLQSYRAATGREWPALDFLCGSDSPNLKVALNLFAEDSTFSVLVLENLLPAYGGASFYESLFRGDPPADWRDRVRPALECAQRLAQRGAKTEKWPDSLALTAGGQMAQFTVNGDWANGAAKGRLNDGTLTPAVFPNTEKMFVFTSDTFPLPKRAAHQADVEDLLVTMTLGQAQRDFMAYKGSIPARTDVTIDATDGFSAQLARTKAAFDDPEVVKVLATSGLLPYDYPSDDIRGVLLEMARQEAGESAIDTVIEHLANAMPLLKLWQARRQKGVEGDCEQ